MASGKPKVFFASVVVVIIWGISGPLFHFSDTWQLVINTGTTIVTFLLVFLIQNTQNRDNLALHVKLDEIIRAIQGADDGYRGIERKSVDELERLKGDTSNSS